MLVILQRNSANIKSVCSCIIIKDSQPSNIYVRRRFKTNSEVLYYRCTSHNGIHIVNRSHWQTFHTLNTNPSSVNGQIITITACILSPSSAHDHDLYAAMVLKPQWCVLTCIFLSHILLPLLTSMENKLQRQPLSWFIIWIWKKMSSVIKTNKNGPNVTQSEWYGLLLFIVVYVMPFIK
jgi:hypothetical protein